MATLKPFIRITILSIILTSLLIYLGIKYHWGDHIKKSSNASVELHIPDEKVLISNYNVVTSDDNNLFAPEIIKNNTSSSLLDSMNKEQITEQCVNFLSKELKDPLILELATVNCVVSNFQATYQNLEVQNNQIELEIQKKQLLFKQQCNHQFVQSSHYSMIEKQLMMGICVSDKLNTKF